LKLLEGSVVGVPPHGGRKHPDQPLVHINTKNILFICGGAFEGLDRLIKSRLNKQNIGFKSDSKSVIEDMEDNPLRFVLPQDIRKFGLIPELLGRLPVITYLDKLTADALRRILTEPKNAIIKQYKKLFELDGIKMEINEEALELIVSTAVDYNLGARGLRSICEVVFRDAMFDAPSKTDAKELIIDLNYVEHKLGIWRKALGKAA
jgi:ATP-dependent Clp protease ATP-binding subunit ClpX